MIADVVKAIRNRQEAENLLAQWRRRRNYLMGYVLGDEVVIGIFSCTADSLQRAKEPKDVPVLQTQKR